MTSELPTLQTYTDSEPLDLASADVDFITQRLGGKVNVSRPAQGEGFVLNSQQYACVISLPSGKVLRSVPRIDARNLFVMLAYAYGLPPDTFEEVAQFGELDSLLEFVAAYWCGLVEERLEHGLYRAYVEQEDNLSFLRGRIAFTEDVRRNVIMRQRTYCRYSELVWDVPENQVLRFVAHALVGWNFGAETRGRLDNIDHRMDEVSRPRFVARDLERFQYHRLNLDYEPMHQLCRLFLDEMSLSEDKGETSLNGFMLDMNKLFERFVTEGLRRESNSGWFISDQEDSYLGSRRRPQDSTYRPAIHIRPDIVLRNGIDPRAVLDCKFKRTSSSSFKHHDFYQVLSYCTSLATDHGALIYPRSELELDEVDETLIRASPITIRRFAINLAVDASALPAELSRLAADVFGWAGEGLPAGSEVPAAV